MLAVTFQSISVKIKTAVGISDAIGLHPMINIRFMQY